jgi:hypothetical protein
MSERQIDAAIDAAVRELMDVDADPAFRARVAARLHKRKAPVHVWQALAVASAAAALIAIGVFVVRDTPAPRPDQAGGVASIEPRAATTPRDIEPPPPVPPARRARASHAAPDAATHAIPRGTLVGAVADLPRADLPGADLPGSDLPAAVVPLSDASGGVEPLAPIPPIAVATLAPAPLGSGPAIDVAPLAPLPQLVITPLNERNQRD